MSAWNDSSRTPETNNLGRGISPRSVAGMLRRRKLLVIAVFALVTAAFVAAAYLLPPRYEAETLLEVAPPTSPEDGGETLTAQSQLPRITEVVYRPSNLEQVIRKLDLFPDRGGRITDRELDLLESRVGVRVEGERTFSLRFEGGDPHQVVLGSSMLAELLVDTTRNEREQRAEASSEFIERQIEPVEAKLQRQKRQIEDYRERWSSETPEQAPASLKLLESTQTQLQELSGTIAEAEARRVAIRRELTELERQGVSASKSPAETRLDQLSARLRTLRQRYTERYPEVIRVENQIDELKQQIADGTTETTEVPEPSPLQVRYLQLQADLDAVEQRLRSSRRQQDTLRARQATYQQRVDAAPRHESALDSMEQEVATTRDHYLQLLGRLQEAQLAESRDKTLQGSLYQIVEPPRLPSAPTSPDRLRLMLMGLVAATGLSLVAAFLVEQMDPTFHQVDEVEGSLGPPVLATIPKQSRRERRQALKEGVDPDILAPPQGLAAEQYRMLATRLAQELAPAPDSAPGGTIMVTGPVGGEGKTTTAIHLAAALVHREEGSVLLVDADVGHPSVHRFLGLPSDDSLDRLLKDPEADPCRHARRQGGLWLLEAGSRSAGGTISTRRLHRLFERLRRSFDYMVVDAPPILALAEGLVLQRTADSVLLVVRARETRRDAAQRALANLDSGRLAGIVLNGVDSTAGYAAAYPYATKRTDEVALATAGARS